MVLAVGPRVGHFDIADRAAGAALVDDHRPTGPAPSPVRAAARAPSGRCSAGREGDHHVDRAGWGSPARRRSRAQSGAAERDDRQLQCCIRCASPVLRVRPRTIGVAACLRLRADCRFALNRRPIPAANTRPVAGRAGQDAARMRAARGRRWICAAGGCYHRSAAASTAIAAIDCDARNRPTRCRSRRCRRARRWRGRSPPASPAGFAARSAHLPLPWLLGALFTTTALSLAGAPVRLILGSAGGNGGGRRLDRAAVHRRRWSQKLDHAAAADHRRGVCLHLRRRHRRPASIMRLTGVDRTTAFFATVPGGVVETTNIAAAIRRAARADHGGADRAGGADRGVRAVPGGVVRRQRLRSNPLLAVPAVALAAGARAARRVGGRRDCCCRARARPMPG